MAEDGQGEVEVRAEGAIGWTQTCGVLAKRPPPNAASIVEHFHESLESVQSLNLRPLHIEFAAGPRIECEHPQVGNSTLEREMQEPVLVKFVSSPACRFDEA